MFSHSISLEKVVYMPLIHTLSMITSEALCLLRELAKGPRTRRDQRSYGSMFGIRNCEDAFEDYGFVIIQEIDGRHQKQMTITEKGRKFLELCEEIVKLGVDFD